MASKIQIRRDTASNWTSADPTLSNGELGLETDTRKLKAGDGSTAWSSLAYYTLGVAGYITATSTDTLTNKTLTAPKIVDAGFIADANGAEQIIFQTTASAVNQFDVTNAATGNPPKLSATGDDSNIDFDLEAKGTGHVTIRGNTNSGAIQFNCENNSHGVIVSGPAHSAAASYSITLPDALGTSQNSAIVSTDANGDVNLAEELKAKSYNETYVAVSSSSNATAVNCEAGNSFSHTLTENTTFTFGSPPTSGTSFTFSLKLVQDASASGFTVTWPGAVDWAAATAPTLTATASAVDYFVFTTNDGGTTWYGFTAAQAMA